MTDITEPLEVTMRLRKQAGETVLASAEKTHTAKMAAWHTRPIRLLITCGLFLVIVVLAIALGTLSVLRERDIADKKRGLDSLALVLAEQIDRGFESIAIIQAAIIERMQSLDVHSADDLRRQMSDYQTHRRFSDRVSGLPHINAIVLTDADGRLINSSRAWPVREVKIPDRDPSVAFKANPKLSTLVGDPLRSPVTGRWVVPLARKFVSPADEFLGVVSGLMELQHFEKLFRSVAHTPSASISLFRADGTLLVRHPHQEAAVGQPFPNSTLQALLIASDHRTVRKIGVFDGQDRLISARSLANHPLAIAVTMTTSEALINWTQTASIVALSVMVIGLLVGGTVFFSIWLVGRTINEKNIQRDIILDSMPQGLAMFDSAMRLLFCNDRYYQMYNLPPDLAKPGAAVLDLIKYRALTGTFVGDSEEYVRSLRAAITDGTAVRNVVETGDGRTINITYQPTEKGGWISTHKDVTKEKSQEEALVQAHQDLLERQYAIDQAVIVAITDVKGVITYVNDHFCRISGYTREELIGSTHRIVTSGVHPKTFFHEMYRQIAAGGVWRGEVCNKAKAGSLYWVDTTITPLFDRSGKPVAYMAIRVDITARKQAEQRISYLATHDALTGIGNRTVLIDKLEEALARYRRQNTTFSVLLLDLDGFKYVNDTLGHAAGDELLKELAIRLNSILNESEILTRLGGDEFAIIQGSKPNQRKAAADLAVRLLETVNRPFNLDGHEVTVGTSIGIACAPDDVETAGQILQKADLALYRVKSEGRNDFLFFDQEMTIGIVARLELLNDLRSALANDEFELYYQPIFDVKTCRPCSVETLVRWRHPIRGFIAPDQFIPLAEETGLMEPLGVKILERACRDAVSWPRNVKVSVNLSATQFRSGKLFDIILCVLVESGLPPERLELEITETVLMQNIESCGVILQQLKNLGVSIALDDFGIGYSSFGYLTKFPFDKIKIDKSFTQEMSTRTDCAAVIASVLTFARGLDILVTAEGVETRNQFDLLRAEGVHQVQGYLFARPTPVKDLKFGAADLNEPVFEVTHNFPLASA